MYTMTAQSSNPSLEIAITEIVNTFKANLFKPKLVLYFGSAQYPQKDLAQIMYKQLHEQFECDCIGASSETEYFDGELKHKSIVAMGFARGLEDYFIKVVSMKTKDIAFSAIEQEISSHFNTPFADLAPDKYFGLILDDFHTQNQDYFIRNLKQLTKITFVGGCASDKSELAQHFVHYNGEIPSDSCIITILKPSFKFKFEKMHSHVPTDIMLTPTETDGPRIVKKINGRRAATVLAEALNMSENAIYKDHWKLSLGLKDSDGNFSVFAMHQIFDDGGILFFADIQEGTEYHLMTYLDTYRDARKKLRNVRTTLAENSLIGAIQFNCIGRYFTSLAEGNMDAYSQLFGFCPHIGITSSGEFLDDFVNFTSAFVIFYK